MEPSRHSLSSRDPCHLDSALFSAKRKPGCVFGGRLFDDITSMRRWHRQPDVRFERPVVPAGTGPSLRWFDEPTRAAPPDGREPSLRFGDRGRVRRGDRGRRACPAVEPRSRAARIDRGCRAQVLAKVQQHVDQRVADLARGRESARVIPPAPYAAAAAERPVDGASGAGREALKAPDQRLTRGGFDDEVDVVRLYRKLDRAERRASLLGEPMAGRSEMKVSVLVGFDKSESR